MTTLGFSRQRRRRPTDAGQHCKMCRQTVPIDPTGRCLLGHPVLTVQEVAERAGEHDQAVGGADDLSIELDPVGDIDLAEAGPPGRADDKPAAPGLPSGAAEQAARLRRLHDAEKRRHWVPGVDMAGMVLPTPSDRAALIKRAPIKTAPTSTQPTGTDKPASPEAALPLMEDIPPLPDAIPIEEDPQVTVLDHAVPHAEPATATAKTAAATWSLDDLDPTAASAMDIDDVPVAEPRPEPVYALAELEPDLINPQGVGTFVGGLLFVVVLFGVVWYLATVL